MAIAYGTSFKDTDDIDNTLALAWMNFQAKVRSFGNELLNELKLKYEIED